MTNTKNTPIEALERTFPLRVLRCRLRRGSGGVGRAPGGEGIERDLQVLEDCTVSLITERRVSRPWGLWGGESVPRGRTGCCPKVTTTGLSACPTSARSGSNPVTCCECSRLVEEGGDHHRSTPVGWGINGSAGEPRGQAVEKVWSGWHRLRQPLGSPGGFLDQPLWRATPRELSAFAYDASRSDASCCR
jgi:N-methylhydantoinase B/oxoprolinase/acetone carboxylase alpha subunit